MDTAVTMEALLAAVADCIRFAKELDKVESEFRGRELDLAINRLEEAEFWFKKIVRTE